MIAMTSDASNIRIDLDATYAGSTSNVAMIRVPNQTLDRLSISGRYRGFDQLVDINANATVNHVTLGADSPLVLSSVGAILSAPGEPDVGEVETVILVPGGADAIEGRAGNDGPNVLAGAVIPQKRGAGAELTIASGVVTATHQAHKIDTEGGAASDDLDTINGGAFGDVLTISAAVGVTVVAKNGTGNLTLGADRSLNEAGDTLVLRKYADGNWHQVDFFSVT